MQNSVKITFSGAQKFQSSYKYFLKEISSKFNSSLPSNSRAEQMLRLLNRNELLFSQHLVGL